MTTFIHNFKLSQYIFWLNISHKKKFVKKFVKKIRHQYTYYKYIGTKVTQKLKNFKKA